MSLPSSTNPQRRRAYDGEFSCQNYDITYSQFVSTTDLRNVREVCCFHSSNSSNLQNKSSCTVCNNRCVFTSSYGGQFLINFCSRLDGSFLRFFKAHLTSHIFYSRCYCLGHAFLTVICPFVLHSAHTHAESGIVFVFTVLCTIICVFLVGCFRLLVEIEINTLLCDVAASLPVFVVSP